MLAALGFNRKTNIFVAGSNLYGGCSRLAALTSLYPKLVTKENLLSSAELEPFANYSSQLAALDFIGCAASDAFAMTESGSQLSSLVSGYRIYYGGGRMPTIRPNKRMLASIFMMNSTIEWRVFVKVAGGTKHLPHLWDLCNNEIVVSSAKHVIKAWQCSPGKEFAWNALSLFTTSGMLYLEISLMAFLLNVNYMNAMEAQALAHTSILSGSIVLVDTLLKAIYVFGFGVPLFNRNVGSTHTIKWGLWTVHKLLLAAAYGFILFEHFSKWREKLPPRPTFYNYVVVMFIFSAITMFACGLAGIGAGLGNWLYDFTVLCYHSLYLPFLYVTFLADFFQEEDFLLDNAYYSEMKDAGFFDAEWE